MKTINKIIVNTIHVLLSKLYFFDLNGLVSRPNCRYLDKANAHWIIVVYTQLLRQLMFGQG